jgi:hypothetical protein
VDGLDLVVARAPYIYVYEYPNQTMHSIMCTCPVSM